MPCCFFFVLNSFFISEIISSLYPGRDIPVSLEYNNLILSSGECKTDIGIKKNLNPSRLLERVLTSSVRIKLLQIYFSYSKRNVPEDLK